MPLTQADRYATNVLLTDGVGTTGTPGSYFGFGGVSTSPSSTGPRFQAGVGSPIGVVTSPLGSSWIDSATGIEYLNVNGGTTWAIADALAVLYDSTAIGAPAASLSTGALATGYRAHLIWYIARTNTAADAEIVSMRVNGDAVDANYMSVAKVDGAASAATVDSKPWINAVPSASTGAGIASGAALYVPYPEETTFHKWAAQMVGGDDRANPGSLVEMRTWRHLSTAAIASYTFLPGSGGSFIAGSHFVVYGIP